MYLQHLLLLVLREQIMNTLDVKVLRNSLDYNPETGIFRRKNQIRGRRSPDGQSCGAINGRGYRTIKVNGKAYSAHRLAWLYMYGEFPPSDLDHINRDKTDNRILNLRVCTEAQNLHNARKIRTKKELTSPHKGVSVRLDGRCQARITINKKTISLGYFNSEQDAHAAYCKAAKHHFDDFAFTGAS